MKKIISIILVISLFLSVAACSDNSADEKTTSSSADEGYVFTDDTGREISVKNPQHVASLLGSFADMWILAGGEVSASADDLWEDFCRDSDAVNIGPTHRPDTEALLASEPDLVLASSKLKKHVEMKDIFESADIPCAYFNVCDFNSYLRVLKIMTDILGTPENYKKYGTDQKEKIDAIISSHKNDAEQTVLTLRASAGSIRAKNSEGTMLGGMLRDFGCRNIADSDKMLLEELNIESIVELNPDKIFFIETGDDIEGIKKNTEKMFAENPLWNELDAVKNDKVYYMDKHLYNLKPNSRFAEAYENLEKILYE